MHQELESLESQGSEPTLNKQWLEMPARAALILMCKELLVNIYHIKILKQQRKKEFLQERVQMDSLYLKLEFMEATLTLVKTKIRLTFKVNILFLCLNITSV